MPAAVTGGASRAQFPAIKGDISFDLVHFRYRPDSAEALRGISFNLKPGEVLGLVGRSGSGKSTIAKLMQSLYVPLGLIVDSAPAPMRPAQVESGFRLPQTAPRSCRLKRAQ